MSMFKKSALTLAISSSLLLAACGGGGGGGNKSPQPDPTAPVTQYGVVEGAAVKGMLKKAIVTAHELSSDGVRVRVVGDAVSDANGRYSIALNSSYQGGPIEIEVAATAETTMTCDTLDGCAGTQFGQDVAVPGSFKMSAILAEAAAGGKVEAAVTPWTHMAAARTKTLIAEGASAKDAAKKAVSETSQIVGFDIAKTKAADLSAIQSGTATAEEVKYAAVNAALASILLSDPTAVSEKLEQLSTSFSDGKFDDNDSVKIGQIKDGLNKVLASEKFETAVADKQEVAGDLINVVTDLPDEGEYDPSPVDDDLLDDDKVASFKAFSQQVRSWVGTLETTDFDTPLTALDVDVETVQNVMNEDSAASVELLAEVLGQTLEHVNDRFKDVLANPETLLVAIKNDDGTELGTVSVNVTTANGVTLALNGTIEGEAGSVTLSNVVVATNVPATDFSFDEEGFLSAVTAKDIQLTLSGSINGSRLDGNGAAVDNSTTTLTLNEVALKLTATTALTYGDGVTDEAVNNALASVSLVGDVAIAHSNNSSFSGKVTAEVVRLGATIPQLVASASISKLAAEGSFTGTKGSFNASVTLNVANAANFDTFGALSFNRTTKNIDVELASSILLPESRRPTDDSVVLSENYMYGDRDLNGNLRVYLTRTDFKAEGHINAAEVLDVAAGTSAPAFESTLLAALTAHKSELVYGTDVDFDNYEIDGLLINENGSQETQIRLTPKASVTPAMYFGNPYIDLDNDGDGDQVGYIDDKGTIGISLMGDTPFHGSLVADFDLPEGSLIRAGGFSTTTDGGLGYSKLSSREFYESCVSDPDAVLAELVASQYDPYPIFDESWNDESKLISCRYRLLAQSVDGPRYSPEALLSANDTEALTSYLMDLLGTRYNGALVEDVRGVESFWLSTEETVDLQVKARFGAFEKAGYFAQGSLTIGANLTLPELPEAKVTATAVRDKLNGGNINAKVSWDGGSYNVSLTVDDISGEQVPATAVLSNSAGHRLVLQTVDTEADKVILTGGAYVGEDKVGNVETTDQGVYLIRYTDNSFETLY